MAKGLTREKARLRALLGGRCAACGTTGALDLEHIDPRHRTKRKLNLGEWRDHYARGWLQLLCRPCHLEKNVHDRVLKGQRAHWEHGTITGYYIHGCREECCRWAQRMYALQTRWVKMMYKAFHEGRE